MQNLSELKYAILDVLLEDPCIETKSVLKAVNQRGHKVKDGAVRTALNELRKAGLISSGHAVHLNRYSRARKHYVFIQTRYPWEQKDWTRRPDDYQSKLISDIKTQLKTNHYDNLLLIGIRKIIGGPCDIVMELASSPGGFDTVTDFVTNHVRTCDFVASTTTASEVLTNDRGDAAVPDEPQAD